MTKDQERKQLEKIAALIKEAGPDSYIAITFSGIIEQAEENIENDFANNYKELYEHSKEVIKEMKRDSDGDQKTIEDLRSYNRTLSQQLDTKNDRIDELNKEIHDAAGDISEYIDKQYEDKKRIESLETEIITLKAKLYDLMTKNNA